MSHSLRLVSAAAVFAVASLSTPAFAQTTTYTSSATFLANVAPGYFFNDFNGLTNPPPATYGGVFNYSVTSSGGLYASGTFLGTNLPDTTLVVTFTSGNVTAVGGNFWNTNISDVFQASQVTLLLNNGTTRSYIPSSASVGSFTGFTSSVPITSLTITGFTGQYVGMDNLVAGSVVPEPGTWLLMALGFGGLLLARQRRAA